MRRLLLAAAVTSIVNTACAQPLPAPGRPNFDANHDGIVTRDEFNAAAAAGFARLDANDDERLTGAELAPPGGGGAPLPRGGDGPPSGALGGGPPGDAIADENGDGVVTRSEFLQDMDGRFSELDRNRDGRLSGEEAPRPPAP